MPRHVDVFLNGISLQRAVPKLWITKCTEEAAAPEVTTAVFPAWEGERPVRVMRRSLRVQIAAQIHVVHDLTRRAALLEDAAAWVGDGGILTVSYRPGRRLRVVPTAVPSLGNARDYTQELTLELTAYAPPFWEDADPVARSFAQGTSGEILLPMTGSVRAPLDCEVEAKASVTEFALTVGDLGLYFEGLSLSAGQKLILSHEADGFLTAEANGIGALRKRTSDSEDDLYVQPGPNTVGFESDGACAVTVSARGRYR